MGRLSGGDGARDDTLGGATRQGQASAVVFAAGGGPRPGRLNEEDARRLIDVVAGFPVDPQVSAALTARCDGNPGQIVAGVERLSVAQLLGHAALPEQIPAQPGEEVVDLISIPRVEVRLLDGLEVRSGGWAINLGEGTVATAVKVVALRGQLPAEELEEILWPEAEPGRGRVRLRNVLHRVRQSCGPLVMRDGRLIRLAAGVEVDAHVFEELADKALTAASCHDPEAGELARRALRLYRGDLLPVDRSADWTTAPRERLARLHLAVLDVLEEEAAERDDATEALRILEEAIDKDPYNETRYIRAARLLADRGSVSKALTMLRRAQAAMGRLGLPSLPAIDEMVRELSG